MNLILLTYIVAAALVLSLMGRRLPDAAGRNNYLSLLTIIHTVICLGISVVVLFKVPVPSFYFNRYLFVDSLVIYEVLIATVIFLLSACYARGYVCSLLEIGEINPRELRLFYIAFNLLLLTVVFAFYCNNLALFWILLELTTIFSAVLIVTLNAKENILAALKYIFSASTAMLFSIIGLIILFAITSHTFGTGTLNWDVLMQEAAGMPPQLFTLAFIFIFIGFAAKAGIVPFHMWLPQAHAKAPSVISVLLSAVLLNIGAYGILRMYAVAHHTISAHIISLVLIIFGLLSIAVAAFSMLPRGNVKKLIAFSSIEHMGFILVGIGIGTPAVIFWVLFHTLAHALVKTLLFFSAGILHQQYSSNQFEDIKGALSLQPLASWGLITGSIAIIGMPLFPVFLSKLNILVQLGGYSLPVLFIVLVLFLVVAAAFAAIFIRTFTQKAEKPYREYRTSPGMRLPMIVLFVVIIFLGVYFPDGLQRMLSNIVTGLGF